MNLIPTIVKKSRYYEDMKALREEMNNQFSQIMSMVKNNPALSQIKPEALIKKKLS